MSIRQTGVGQGWRELPGIDDIMSFEPGLNCLFALDAGKFVLELCGLQCGANFLFTFRQEAAVFGADICCACGLAQSGQTIAQSRRGTTRGCGRIVELVSEACGKFAERGQLLMLLLGTGDVANAVREQTHEAADKFRQSSEEFDEVADWKTQVVRGNDGATGDADHLQPRKRQRS